MAYKTFVNGFPLNASEMNTFLMNQTVSTFADSAARTAAIATPAEGQITYLNSDNKYYKYDGAAWVEIVGMSDGAVAQSPNYIINGAFDIWQRGTSFTSITDGAYSADRWKAILSGATATITREAFTPAELVANGFGEASHYLRLDITGADDNASMRQRIEDVRTLAGQTVAISFWAKASSATTLSAALGQNFGSGGSTAVFQGFGSQAIGTSWTRYVGTATLPSISGKTVGTNSYLECFISNPNNETNTIDIWGFQLEAGSVATPFRRNANSIQGELAACQRYYYLHAQGSASAAIPVGTGYLDTADQGYVSVHLPVQMRITPTLEATTGTQFLMRSQGLNGVASTMTFHIGSNTIVHLGATRTSGVALGAGNGLGVWCNTETGRIAFSGEL